MASRRGRRIVSAAFLLFAATFIVVSTIEIARGVYGEPVASGEGPPPSAACVAGIKVLVAALDRAMAAGASAHDESAALREFAGTAKPEWDGISETENACSATPQGKDAFAALVRLRAADESFLRRRVAEVAPLRRDVDAYLR